MSSAGEDCQPGRDLRVGGHETRVRSDVCQSEGYPAEQSTDSEPRAHTETERKRAGYRHSKE